MTQNRWKQLKTNQDNSKGDLNWPKTIKIDPKLLKANQTDPQLPKPSQNKTQTNISQLKLT